MKRLIEVIARTSDLVEAHGRTLRATVRGEARELGHAIRAEAHALRGYFAAALLGLLCLLIAALCFVGGAGLVCAAGYLWLEPRFGPAMAAACVGAAVLLLGGTAIWTFRRLMAE